MILPFDSKSHEIGSGVAGNDQMDWTRCTDNYYVVWSLTWPIIWETLGGHLN